MLQIAILRILRYLQPTDPSAGSRTETNGCDQLYAFKCFPVFHFDLFSKILEIRSFTRLPECSKTKNTENQSRDSDVLSLSEQQLFTSKNKNYNFLSNLIDRHPTHIFPFQSIDFPGRCAVWNSSRTPTTPISRFDVLK